MQDYIVEAKHITKSFSGVKALDGVNFNLRAGEVMALLGENGAGKSTLMKILSGIYTRDDGELKIFGESVGNLNPIKAKELGIAIIHQEINMCPHLSVAENIFLGRERAHSDILSNKEMNKEAKEILSRMNIDISPDTIVGELSVSKQQMIEIAKAISTNARILIMDEPTSALTSREIDELFGIIKKLKREGCGIVYISHRLEELKHIVDRVTIMRDGKYITSMNFKDTTMPELISNMVGREIKEKFPRVNCKRGKKILEIKNLSAGKSVNDISLDLYEGEIVGIAGLVGAGRTETSRAIFGIDKKDSGEVVLDGKKVEINKPIDAIKAGIVLVPEDRKKDGLCTKLSIRENIVLPNLDLICSKLGILNRKKEKEMVDKAVKDFQIKLASTELDAGSLSGGNQQKIVVGKWLSRNSRVVIFDEPTRGIDVAVKVEIYNLMNKLKQEGIGVICISSELPEIMGISDRILVMCDGRITGELDIKEATQDLILEYATKFESKNLNSAAKEG
jgi:ribose transport system ATP-binding protein